MLQVYKSCMYIAVLFVMYDTFICLQIMFNTYLFIKRKHYQLQSTCLVFTLQTINNLFLHILHANKKIVFNLLW